ncbi:MULTISPECIES: AAA family ATPase [Rhodococcus]|uniref:Sensor kinase, two-component system n=1 Tax=Rhodococcus jostii (strain RHA1) TaxID=101510 RepID=Q0RWJ5_RHOJR|nr:MULTISPECIES: AAA family ATPase [Rhodococcus]ABH00341.1 sensor kinase, two-component system [Rhodococcus jostii RHA1]
MTPDRVDKHKRIDLIRELRVGWGASTNLGVNAETHEHVVVRKLDLSVTRPWSWDWLTHELETMASSQLLHHVTTKIVRKSADEAVLVRPVVAGRDILEWAAHEPRPSIDTYLRVMCDLLFALAQLHSMGIAHGGLKPANIMLTESGHLILLDASITRTQLAATTYPVNSADGRYLPPEHAGRLHRTVGFAADIFAAGWVLLEAAAERNRTASALRSGADGRDMTPEGLAHLVDVVGVPPALRPVILKLLSPLREHRYESAEDALAAVEAVLATSIGEAGLVPTASTAIGGSLAYLEPPLVGRRAELDTLNFYVERATRPTRAVLCMSGESGLGKSRLLDAVAIHANAMGVTVLRGGAFEYAAQRPLGLFAEPFRDIVTYLRAHPGEADRMRREMGELLGPAIELIPGLAGVFADLPTTDVAGLALDDGSAAAAPTAAIARLLQGVFTKARPGLLMLDDCQWADDLSWQVLAKVASETSRGAGSPVYVSLICSCRPEAVAQVKSWDVDGIDFLELEPLSSSDTEELVRSIDNHIPDEIVPYVIRYSGGNPMETLSVFRALIDSSALTREAGRWVVNEDEMRSLPVLSQPRSLDASGMREGTRTDVFVSARLDLLSANTQQAMRQGAILGRQFPSPLLCGALGASAEDVRYLLREGMERGIIRRVAGVGAENFEFTHDRLREAVLRSLTEEQRRDTHRRAAQALEGSAEGQSDYEIAYHLNRSGQVAAAMPYALRAGEAGLRQHALDVAESNFEIAEAGLQLLQSIGDREKFRVYEGLGTVHMLLASYDLAAEKLTRAHEIAQALPGLESARVATLLGELAFKTGRFEDAAAWMQQGMQHLGLRVPGRPLAAAASSLGEVAILALGWVSRRIRPTRANAGTERDRLAARIYDRLAYEWWFVRSPIWVRWAILRGVRFANAGGSTRERSHAYSMAAAIISGTAPILAPVSLRLAVRSLRLCQAAKDDWGVAHAQHFRGFVLLAAARYDEAIESLDASITAFDTVGDRWEQIAAMWQKALCLFRLGMLHEAGVLARETYREGKRIGDRIGAGTALAIWVRCLPADVSVETLSRELRRTNSDDHHTTAMLQAARGWRLFHSDEYEQAVDAFRQADELLRHSGIRNHFVAPITTWHLQVLRLMHDAAPAWWAGERRNRAKAARRQLARALRSAIIFRGERPTVLREWAMMSFAEGHSWRGRLILRAATRSAVNAAAGGDLAACSSVEELAWIKLRRGSLGQLPPARELCRRLAIRVDRGIAEAVPSGVMPTGGDSSRHRSLLDAVGRIVASDDVEEVLAKLREATMATTSARRVEISRLPESVGPGGVPNGSPGASLGEPIVTGEAARGMKMTERIAKPVVADGHNASSVVAAFPLGEGHYHEPTVEVLAALAGAVIEREKLRRRSMEWIVDVQEAERGRIARDLHDEFGHLFAGITEGLSALEKVGDEATRRVTMDVRKIVRQGIQAARVGAWSLRPSGLDDLGLPGCVEQLVEDCRQMFPLRIELTATGHAGPIPPSVETAVFRIVQEALTNIDRHSRAAAASVVLVCSGHTVRAVVEDDGIGFDVDVSGQSGSLGLIGMRERARLVRGRLTVDSQPGQGTIVMVEVPIRR